MSYVTRCAAFGAGIGVGAGIGIAVGGLAAFVLIVSAQLAVVVAYQRYVRRGRKLRQVPAAHGSPWLLFRRRHLGW